MRPSWMLAIAACLAAPAFADAPMSLKSEAVSAVPPAGHEQGLYRFGATYSVTPSDTAMACQAACAEDDVCKAWSFVAAAGEAGARCELKRSGGQVEHNPLATSGFSPAHEARFSPLPEEPVDELLGADASDSADHIKAITVEIEKADVDGPTDLTETGN